MCLSQYDYNSRSYLQIISYHYIVYNSRRSVGLCKNTVSLMASWISRLSFFKILLLFLQFLQGRSSHLANRFSKIRYIFLRELFWLKYDEWQLFIQENSYFSKHISFFRNRFRNATFLFSLFFSFTVHHHQRDGIMLENVLRKNVKFILPLFFECMRVGSYVVYNISYIHWFSAFLCHNNNTFQLLWTHNL